MQNYLLIRLKAPMMSFGDTDTSEDRKPIMRHPGKSMIAGLLANALGYDHRQPEMTQALQDEIEIASLELKRGKILIDHQTAEISYDDTAWTTAGIPAERGGHPYSYAVPLRCQKEYLAGAEYIVAVSASAERLQELSRALREPARPLFIGRRCCLPSRPLFAGLIRAQGIIDALRTIGKGHARWPACAEGAPHPEAEFHVADIRDWHSRHHAGRRPVHEGII